MRRHLMRSEAIFALRRGAAVAQFFGLGATDEGERTFRFVEVIPAKGRDRSLTVYLQHKFVGPPGFADVVELADVEEWESMDDDGDWLGDDRRSGASTIPRMPWHRRRVLTAPSPTAGSTGA
jgi:hypothetical protein